MLSRVARKVSFIGGPRLFAVGPASRAGPATRVPPGSPHPRSRRAAASLRPPLVDQRRHQTGPAGLVAGAEAGAVVAVEVLVKEDQVAPVRVALELLGAAVDRPPSLPVAREDADE